MNIYTPADESTPLIRCIAVAGDIESGPRWGTSAFHDIFDADSPFQGDVTYWRVVVAHQGIEPGSRAIRQYFYVNWSVDLLDDTLFSDASANVGPLPITAVKQDVTFFIGGIHACTAHLHGNRFFSHARRCLNLKQSFAMSVVVKRDLLASSADITNNRYKRGGLCPAATCMSVE